MDWTVKVLDSADREIRRLPAAWLKEEALDCLEHLGTNPFPEGYVKLRGYSNDTGFGLVMRGTGSFTR